MSINIFNYDHGLTELSMRVWFDFSFFSPLHHSFKWSRTAAVLSADVRSTYIKWQEFSLLFFPGWMHWMCSLPTLKPPSCRVADGRCDEIIALLPLLFHPWVRENQSRWKLQSNLKGERRREVENIELFSRVCSFVSVRAHKFIRNTCTIKCNSVQRLAIYPVPVNLINIQLLLVERCWFWF